MDSILYVLLSMPEASLQHILFPTGQHMWPSGGLGESELKARAVISLAQGLHFQPC